MTILFASAELFPFSKSGGLADMAYALPHAMCGMGQEVTAVTPLYSFIDTDKYDIRKSGEQFRLHFGGRVHEVEIHRGEVEGMEVLFVYNAILCDREHIYGPPYPDNDLRFAIFCHALVELLLRRPREILHLNDWHTALAALLAKEAGVESRVVYTIHNLAYQGIFPPSTLERCGIGREHFRMEEMEFYGEVNWMKAGIAWADAVTTVSPSYAREILTPEFGCGLEGFLQKHRGKLSGILNGIDTTVFDPARDPALPSAYNAGDPSGKRVCKQRFCDEMNIDKYELPLFAFIGRFVEQKGIQHLAEIIGRIAELPMNLMLLGEGEERFHRLLAEAAERYGNITLRFGYDEALSHRIYAAADFLLMPSTFEPCGLNQMIAMRYGTIPVVHAVGGLRDSVHPAGSGHCGEGVVYEADGAEALSGAIGEALELYENRTAMATKVRRFDMACDFSIERCAGSYLKLYNHLLVFSEEARHSGLDLESRTANADESLDPESSSG